MGYLSAELSGRRRIFASASVATLFFAAGAHAQTAQTATPTTAAAQATTAAPANTDTGLAEVVVTAQKRVDKVNNVPESITAIAGLALEKAEIKNPSDLSRVVPGFQAAPSGFGQPIYFLRGIGFFDTSLQSKPAVTVYTDEQPYPLPALSAGATFDNQRVEVLKGPQGTLFGSNSTGGTINFIANKPTDHLTGGLDASYGRFNDFDVSGFVSGPITNDLDGRIALRHESADPWQQPFTAGSGKNGAKDFTQGRAIFDWKPTDRLKVELNLNGFIDEGTNQASQFLALFPQTAGAIINPGLLTFPAAPHDDRAADGGDNGDSLKKHNDFMQGNVRVDYNLTNDITLTSLTSIDRYTENYGADLDGTPFADQDFHITGSVTSYNQEVRAAGDFHDKLHWILGANYEYTTDYEAQNGLIFDSSSGHTFQKLGFTDPIFNEVDIARDRFESEAVFTNLDYNITDQFTAHAGVRYTATQNRFEGCLTSDNATLGDGLSKIEKFAPGILPGQCIEFNPAGQYVGLVHAKLDETNVPWRVGLDWKPDHGTLLYGNISRGFKSGGFPNLGATNTRQYVPVKQEEVTAYELGVKKTLLDNTLQLNAAVFYDDYLNKQLKGKVIDPIFGALNAIINVPRSSVTGAEAQVTWKIDRHLILNGGVTYLDTQVIGNFEGFTFTGAQDNFKGAAFPFTPKWQVNGDAEYDWDLSDKFSAYAGASVTYRSETSSEFIPATVMDIDAYTLLDLRAGVTTRDGKWRVQLAGYNVTNQYYWTQVGRLSDAITRLTGMPATYSLSLSYRFN
jgi:iron complex outermembrane recepter protein